MPILCTNFQSKIFMARFDIMDLTVLFKRDRQKILEPRQYLSANYFLHIFSNSTLVGFILIGTATEFAIGVLATGVTIVSFHELGTSRNYKERFSTPAKNFVRESARIRYTA